MGNESDRGTNKSSENRFAVHVICLSRAPIHSQWTQKKRHSFLNCSSTFTAFNQRFKKWRHGTKWRHMWRHITQMESQRQILCSVENQKLRFYHTDHSSPKKLLSTKRLTTLCSMYIRKFVLGGEWSVVTFGLKRQKISKNSLKFGIRYRFGSL